jgi:hypothetical protein
MKRPLILTLFCSFVLLASSSVAQPILIQPLSVIDMNGAMPKRNMSVSLRDHRIAQIAQNTKPPFNAATITDGELSYTRLSGEELERNLAGTHQICLDSRTV